jgi:hypothetical protein
LRQALRKEDNRQARMSMQEAIAGIMSALREGPEAAG